MSSSLSTRITALRQCFEEEKSREASEYSEKINRLKRQYEQIKKFDYSKDFEETYEASYASLFNIYSDYAAIQDRTLGIEFKMSKYIKTVKPSAIPKGSVETFFEKLVDSCKTAMARLSSSRSVEEDIAPSKILCQGVVDLKYIVDNAKRLLSESGIPEKKRQEDLLSVDTRMKEAEAEHRHREKIENMACFNKISALRKECQKMAEDAEGMYLGARRPEFSGSYKFLIGFTKTEIDKDDLDFAKKVLFAEEKIFANTPVYFELSEGHSSLIVRAPGKFFDEVAYRDFVRNLYFIFATALPAANLKYLGVDLKQSEVPSGRVAARIKNMLGTEYLFAESVKDMSAFGRALDALNATWQANAEAYGDSFSGIFDYNEKNPNAKQPFVLMNISGYPAEFSEDSSETLDNVKMLAKKCGSKGVITVISERTDGAFNAKAPRLSAQELSADVLEFTEDGVKYNGQNITLDITCTGFSADKIWDMLKEYYKKKTSVTLKETLDKLEEDRRGGFRKKTHPADKFSVPMGIYEDAKGFDMEFSFRKDQGFGIILGGTTSGKSSFLHSFILSTASQYAPDEIEFYLADFKKGGDEAPTFSYYLAKSDAENLYVPHVRYTLLKSSPENTVELLKKIISMVEERTNVIHNVSVGGRVRKFESVAEYNDSEEVRSGKAPKLPFVMFIIDEFNNMLKGGTDTDGMDSRSKSRILNEIKTQLEIILKQVRFAGIGLLLAGQDTNGLTDEHLAQIGTRICFSVNEPELLPKIFNIRHGDAVGMMSKFKIGSAYYTNQGKKQPPVFVRTAYAGSTSGEAAQSLAKRIRNKYPEYAHYAKSQIEAGLESFVSYEECKFFEEEQKKRKKANDRKNRYITEHPLLMGLGSAGCLPVYLDYQTSSKARNYFAVADEEKQIILARNVIFSYLDLAKSEGFSPDISYFAAKKEIRNACIEEYIEEYAELEDSLSVIRKKSDLAKKIMELSKILAERERLSEDEDEDNFDPIMLVISEIDWLNDKKKLNWLPGYSAEGGTPENKPARAPTRERRRERRSDFDELFDEAMNESVDDISAASDGVAERRARREAGREARAERRAMRAEAHSVYEAPAPKTPSDDSFTDADVREAIDYIFSEGNKYSVYLFVMSSSVKEIEKLFPKVKAPYNYCVFDSLISLSGVNEENPKTSLAYIMPENTKTRLIDWQISDIRKIL